MLSFPIFFLGMFCVCYLSHFVLVHCLAIVILAPTRHPFDCDPRRCCPSQKLLSCALHIGTES